MISGLSALIADAATAQTEPPGAHPPEVSDEEPCTDSPQLEPCDCPAGEPDGRSTVAAKQVAIVPSPAPRPHRGLYLNASLGLGELQVDFLDRSMAGRISPLALEIGVAATSNLIVLSQVYDAHAFGPISDGSQPSFLDLHGLGAGAKYTILPSNVFLSGAMLFFQLSKGVGDLSVSGQQSYWGVGGRLSVGKEWWLSPSWSLGLAGEAVLARMRNNSNYPQSENYDYTAKVFSLLLSTSFNYPPSYPIEPIAPSGTGVPASAPSPFPAGRHTHDGLYVSARLGVGWLWVRSSGAEVASGRGFPFGLSVGFAPISSVVVFAEFFQTSFFEKDSSDLGYWDAVGLRGFGPGLKYYLMPANLFVSGSLLLSRLTVHSSVDARTGNPSFASDLGVTGRFSAGKEWWVSAEWGIGVAGELLLGRMGRSLYDEDDAYTVKGFSLLISASFN
jgi:hypothetical protein